MNILNYTPHDIHMIKGDETITIPSSGLARCQEIKNKVGEVNGFPVYAVSFGEVTGLPEPQPDTIIVVSQLTANGAKAAG